VQDFAAVVQDLHVDFDAITAPPASQPPFGA